MKGQPIPRLPPEPLRFSNDEVIKGPFAGPMKDGQPDLDPRSTLELMYDRDQSKK